VSSHSVRLAKNLRDITFVIEELGAKGKLKEYDRGKLNGLLLCFSMLTGKDYKFKERSK